jgi:hypothetical protein
MVVSGVLGHVSRKLGNFNLLLDVLLKAREHNLPLSRFESITDAGDRASTVSNGEQDKLLVNEVRIAEYRLRVIHKCYCRVVGSQPVFPQVSFLLVKSKVDI